MKETRAEEEKRWVGETVARKNGEEETIKTTRR
jgi:hypothetical protein